MERFNQFSSRVIVLPINDIDTDQIIPARFLKVTDKSGLGANLFSNWRYLADGNPNPDFVLNQPESKDAHILLAGNNFGCGSSREHAPWALIGYGFKAIISTSFADIFCNNALKNGLLPIQVSPEIHQEIQNWLKENPQGLMHVDLEAQEISLSDNLAYSFPIDSFSKTCLVNGVDELGYLLQLADQISAYEQANFA